MVVVSQTPLRMSFFGGGTDFKDYYEKYGGLVISACINKYIYFIVNTRADDNIVLNYDEREAVSEVNQIKHNIFREVLKLLDITKGIEITTLSDITSQGSGLGSSSAFTVGLLNALFKYKGIKKQPYELAELACKVEIDILGNPIGKQDQYAVAFGGLKKYYFNRDETVTVENMLINNQQREIFNKNIVLFNTGITRSSSDILSEQKVQIGSNIDHLHTIKRIAESSEVHINNLDFEKLGDLLNISWNNKRLLANRISNSEIDEIYEAGKKAGAFGGKLLGAGGGGFFLFLCSTEKQEELKKSLISYEVLPVKFSEFGTRIIFESE